jgi:predicted NUDIX family NTP pyrophosphohydrolase
MYRIRAGKVEVLLVHPGGPFWAKKDLGAWFITKGEVETNESPIDTAKREFEEELGAPLPGADLIALGTVRHKSGKLVHGWAVEGNVDCSSVKSNTFFVEWPPRSGKQQEFPEIDRARFFDLSEAWQKMHTAEREFLPRLVAALTERGVDCKQP